MEFPGAGGSVAGKPTPMAGEAIEIALLGELSVRRDRRPVGLPASRKTRALLGYLVLTGAPQPRSRLCELLWEGPVDPRAELRWSLSKLRALLAGDGTARITLQEDAIGFRAAGAIVDCQEVAAALAADGSIRDLAAASRAAALFRGELLAGLELPDCFRFNAWLTAERERLFAVRGRLLERLATLDERDPEEALRWARSWVAIDPIAERAHAAVVRALLALGRRRDATAQVETCRRILRQEVGVAPGEILAAARGQAVLAGRAPAREIVARAADASPVPTAAPPIPAAIPFVGREAELAELAGALDEMSSAPLASALLVAEGEPGIGKSRLLAELARAAERRAFAVVAVRGFETEVTRPFGAWLALAGAGGARHPVVDLGSQLASDFAAAAREGDPARFQRRVAEAFAADATGGRRLLLCCDDLQWIDESSLALLHALLRAPAARGLVVAAALRPGEAGPRSPAARLLRDAERDGRLRRVALGPLPAAASVELVRAAAGLSAAPEPLVTEQVARLAQASAGHPLFAIELARCAAEIGAGLPASLQAAVGERLARVGGGARALLAFAAAAGSGFDVDLLARLSGLAAGELLGALDELEQGAILRASKDGGAYDFSHDIVRRVAYEQIPPPRRRFLHAGLARSLAERPDPDGALAVAVARHAALGGLDRLAAEACLAAAERGLRLGATAEAEESCERGLGALAGLDPAETLGLRFALLRALVHATQGRPHREGLAVEVRRWVEVARAGARHDELQVGLYLLAAIFYAEGDLSAAERHVLDQAEALRGAEPRVAAAALANAGRCLAQIERDHARAEALLREGRELAVQAGVELIDVPWGLGMVAQAAGRDEEAQRELTRALALARAGGDPWIESQCLARLAAMALEQGESAAALATCDDLARLAERTSEPGDAAIAGALATLARCQRGERSAERDLDAAIERLREADSKSHLAFVLNRAAEQDLAADRVDLAAARASEALESAQRVGRRGQTALARLLLAQVAERRGDLASARRELAAAAEQNLPAGALGGRTWTEIEAWERRLAIPTPASTTARHRRRRQKGATP